jgi:K+-transporting ATPase ATPase C chain
MTLRKEFITSTIVVIVMILGCGLLYPLVITGIGQAAFPGNANGQQVYVHGKLVGSKIIGQNFALPVYKNGKPELSKGEPVTTPDPRYFQTRPSGTVPADNDAATSFANYGPNSTVTEKAIAANIAAYIQLNGKYYPGGLTAAKVPVDAGSIPTSLSPTPTSRHTGSPPCVTCRWRPSTARSPSTRPDADLASRVSPPSTCSS